VTDDSSGKLVIDNLPPGTYRLRVSLRGYNDWREEVEVTASAALNVQAELVPTSSGPKPLSQTEVEEMLTNGVPKPRILTFVRNYGVDFILTDPVEQRLRGLGADSDTLLVISKSRK
jgi:hypothetical protein